MCGLNMKEPKILDNRQFGRVGDELKENIKRGSRLSVISAYFTINVIDVKEGESAWQI